MDVELLEYSVGLENPLAFVGVVMMPGNVSVYYFPLNCSIDLDPVIKSCGNACDHTSAA